MYHQWWHVIFVSFKLVSSFLRRELVLYANMQTNTLKKQKRTTSGIYCIFIHGHLKNLSLIDKFNIAIRKMNSKSCFAVCLAENRFRWKNQFQVFISVFIVMVRGESNVIAWWVLERLRATTAVSLSCFTSGLAKLWHCHWCGQPREHTECGGNVEQRLADLKGVYFPRAEN